MGRQNEDERSAILRSVKREEMRVRRLYGRYLELKKCDPEFSLEFFEVYRHRQREPFHKDIPGEQMQKDLIDDLARLMADFFVFSQKYDCFQKEHPEFKINFVEVIKHQYTIMN